MTQFHVHRSKRIFIKIYRNIPAYYNPAYPKKISSLNHQSNLYRLFKDIT